MKKFLLKLSYTFIPIWVALLILVCYISLFLCPQISGDIGRIGMIPFGHEYSYDMRKGLMTGEKFKTVYNVYELKENATEVLTIGDSFSQMGKTGYQNYLWSDSLSVINLNLEHIDKNSLQLTYTLLRDKKIDSTMCKVLIVETVERELMNRVHLLERNYPQLYGTYTPDTATDKDPNAWSLSRARDFVLFRLGYKTPALKAKLKSAFFNCDSPKELYFYKNDIISAQSIPSSMSDKVIECIERIGNAARNQGIKMLFMVAVDKYDLYQAYIEDNCYPTKTINEDLRKIIGERDDVLISKECLAPYIEKGAKDMFLYNDSHWSYKSSKIIAEELNKMISNEI